MHFYANPVLFEFLAGILMGIVYLERRVRSSWAWLFVALGAGFFLLSFSQRTECSAGMTLVAASMSRRRFVRDGLFELGAESSG